MNNLPEWSAWVGMGVGAILICAIFWIDRWEPKDKKDKKNG